MLDFKSIICPAIDLGKSVVTWCFLWSDRVLSLESCVCAEYMEVVCPVLERDSRSISCSAVACLQFLWILKTGLPIFILHWASQLIWPDLAKLTFHAETPERPKLGLHWVYTTCGRNACVCLLNRCLLWDRTWSEALVRTSDAVGSS